MWQVVKSVLMAFFGVQKDKQRRADFEHGKPGVFIVIGLVMASVMVIAVFIVAITAAG